MSLGYEFAPIDVSITTHPKAFAAGVEAMGLWLWGMAYAKQHNTDGRLHRAAVLGAWGGRRNIMHAKRLVEAGLWLEREEGDWDIYNFEKKSPGRRRSEPAGSSTERVRRHRARADETVCNAAVPAVSSVTDGGVSVTSASPSISVSVSSSGEGPGEGRVRLDLPYGDDAADVWGANTMNREPGRPAPDVWRAFCGHFAGQDFRSREALLGRWQKWIGEQFKIADKERDRDRMHRDRMDKRYADHTPKVQRETHAQAKSFQQQLAEKMAAEADAKKGAA